VLCIGNAIVDLICERHLDDVSHADAFVPHFGGAVANIALLAAHAGARVALAGGVGDDAWGHWLRARLEHAGVDVGHFEMVPGVGTRLALVVVDARGEGHYTFYGEPSGVAARLGDELEEALAASTGLFLSSNTLHGDDERELTERARRLALDAGLPVVFDPNLRLGRWSSRAQAAATVNAFVPGATLVCANLAEAQLMTGEDDVERAAQALLKAGAANVVITLGAEGAILRGKLRRDAPGVPVRVVSSVGAGDTVTAVLLARLESSGWYEPALAAGLPDAMAAAARACERWGAAD
jgi:fructokinase